MLSKNRIKQINSLQIKKFRAEYGLFIAEGTKVVLELCRSNMRIKEIFAVPEWVSQYAEKFSNTAITTVTAEEVRKLSAMATACSVVAEVYIPEQSKDFKIQKDKLYIALDSVRDPGNIGTILRIANWFGIDTVIASPDCVDQFNPKVVQASMGSAFRVNIQYLELPKIFSDAKNQGIEIYGTFLNGENIYKSTLSKGGIIVLGNEGHGILPETEKYITRRLNIPCGCNPELAPESLNVSSATAIVCNEFARRF